MQHIKCVVLLPHIYDKNKFKAVFRKPKVWIAKQKKKRKEEYDEYIVK